MNKIFSVAIPVCKHDAASIDSYPFTHCYDEESKTIKTNKIAVKGAVEMEGCKLVAQKLHCDLVWVPRGDFVYAGYPISYRVAYVGVTSNEFGKAGEVIIRISEFSATTVTVGNDPSWACVGGFCFRPLRGSSDYIFDDGMYLEFYQMVNRVTRPLPKGVFSEVLELSTIELYDGWFFSIVDAAGSYVDTYSIGLLVMPVFSAIELTDVSAKALDKNTIRVSAIPRLVNSSSNMLPPKNEFRCYLASDKGDGMQFLYDGGLITMVVPADTKKLYAGALGLYINTYEGAKYYNEHVYNMPTFEVTIDSAPAGASVYVDGELRG